MNTRRFLTVARPAAVVAVLALTLTGCTPSVDDADLEKTITEKVTQQAGVKPEEVDCPDDLPGKKDATMTCTLRHGGQSLDVKLTVTSVKDNKVEYNIELAEQAN